MLGGTALRPVQEVRALFAAMHHGPGERDAKAPTIATPGCGLVLDHVDVGGAHAVFRRQLGSAGALGTLG